jgi:hypothetical protein
VKRNAASCGRYSDPPVTPLQGIVNADAGQKQERQRQGGEKNAAPVRRGD